MISSRYHGSIRLHFLLKLGGATVLFWGLVWLLHLAVYQAELLPSNYVWVSLLIPAAALIEIVVRERRQRSLCGLSRTQVWSITQREILFALVAIFGVIVMSKDDRLSRVFLAAFFPTASLAGPFWRWRSGCCFRTRSRSFSIRAIVWIR